MFRLNSTVLLPKVKIFYIAKTILNQFDSTVAAFQIRNFNLRNYFGRNSNNVPVPLAWG